jgi:NAD(P)-dependent dehydrogenase (short-subunit alcohol dehydrogenase family)
METGLAGKHAVVTGASKGIGLAITQALIREGSFVTAGARTSSPELDRLTDASNAEHIAVDLSSPTGPEELVVAALGHAPVDILINNVGAVTPRLDGFLAITDAQWTNSVTLNLLVAVRTTRAVLPGMIAAGRGSIVTISSVNASLPDPGVIDYGAAKAALTNFCKALSKEVGPHGIRVNTVSPGPVSTALWLGDTGVARTIAAATGSDPESIAQQAVAGTATKRFTTAEEIAHLVLLLAGDRATNITGEDIIIDGGLTQSL